MPVPTPHITPLNIDFSFIPKATNQLMQFKEENDSISLLPAQLQSEFARANVGFGERSDIEEDIQTGIEEIHQLGKSNGIFGYKRNKKAITEKILQLQGIINQAEQIQKYRQQLAPQLKGGKEVIVDGQYVDPYQKATYRDESGNLKFRDIDFNAIQSGIVDPRERNNYARNILQTDLDDQDILGYETDREGNKWVRMGISPQTAQKQSSNINKIEQIKKLHGNEYAAMYRRITGQDPTEPELNKFISSELQQIALSTPSKLQRMPTGKSPTDKILDYLKAREFNAPVLSDFTETGQQIKRPTEYSKSGIKGLNADLEKAYNDGDERTIQVLENRFDHYVKQVEKTDPALQGMLKNMPQVSQEEFDLAKQLTQDGLQHLTPQNVIDFNKWSSKYSKMLNESVDEAIKKDTYEFNVSSLNNKKARENITDYMQNVIGLDNLVYNGESIFDEKGNLENKKYKDLVVKNVKVVEGKHGVPPKFILKTSFNEGKDEKDFTVSLNPGVALDNMRDIAFRTNSPNLYLQYVSDIILDKKDIEFGEPISGEEIFGPTGNPNIKLFREKGKYYVMNERTREISKGYNSDYDALERMFNEHGGSAYIKQYFDYKVKETSSNKQVNDFFLKALFMLPK